MAYLKAAIVMISSVLEGHSPVASVYKCNFWYLWRCFVQSLCILQSFLCI